MASDDSSNPVLRNEKAQNVDRMGMKVVDQTEKLQHKAHSHVPGDSGEKKGPAGGFDDTPVPKAPPGYTLKITFHRAENLPFADFNTLSSDPYILAVLSTGLPKRHKQDPDLTWRTPTIHRNVNPEWNAEWIIANVPASGFFLKCRLYDEDPADHDDRLGNVHIDVNSIGDSWTGFKERKFELKKRMASKRAYTIRGCASLFSKKIKFGGGEVVVSIENLGKTPGDDGGRAYTIGPLAWSQHFSPLIGRLTGIKDTTKHDNDGKQTERYNFQAIQIQFRGPVPAGMYHRYVEFKPFVAGMFTSHSLRGRILNRALHHQHARIYNYDRSTVYGIFQEPCADLAKKFLEFVHYDQGGRIFTYVLTLDGQWRFTETGKEFGVDLLSKHTMHSDVSIYIAFSGEFFIRRLKHPHKGKSQSQDPISDAMPPAAEPDDEGDEPSQSSDAPKEPNYYELVIDNDSGTYRPNAKKLHDLKRFMASNLPGLRVVTLDCTADKEKMDKLKDEQRERKKQTGPNRTYLQNNSQSSLSSSDEEELNERAEGREHESRYKKEMHKFMDGGQDQHHGTGLGNQAIHDDGHGSEQAQQQEMSGTAAGQQTTLNEKHGGVGNGELAGGQQQQ